MEFRRIQTLDETLGDALALTLYRCEHGLVRGWFVGPVLADGSIATVPYEAKSQNLLASVAIVRAMEIAKAEGLKVDVIDFDGLWDEAWGSH